MIKFENPYVLMLFPIALSYFVFTIKRLRGVNRFEKILFTVLRGLVAMLLILGISGLKIQKDSGVTTTIFAVDLSASMSGTEDRIQSFFDNSVKNRGEKDKAGVALFGERAVVGAAPLFDDIHIGDALNTRLDGDYTNIAEALRLSQALISEDSRKRIVLISDGLENIGDGVAAARQLAQKNIVIDTLYTGVPLDAEVQLNQIKAPGVIRAGIKNEIEISGYSSSENIGRLLVYRNDKLISDETVSIRKGENKFLFFDNISDGEQADAFGGVIYRAEILPAADAYGGNNAVYAYAYVEGTLNILASGVNGAEKEIAEILSASGINVDIKAPSELAMTQEEINIYDVVILANVAFDDMPQGFPEILEGYVKNLGGGLIVSGGDNSFGLGDYFNTPMEAMLPVDMRLKEEEETPDIGMIVVLDRSGSMTAGNYGISKIELAKEAVIRSVDALSDNDSFGVLAFDNNFIWASEYRSVRGNKDSMKNEIALISPGGGTSILPALTEAYRSLEHADVRIKHIILLTDGQAESYGYDGLINSMKKNGITLSTIAVGSDSDTALLERLAQLGNGRYYFTNEFTDLPKIFTKETNLAGKSYLNNDVFTPSVGAPSQILSRINALPALGGYVSATLKPRADAVLQSDKDEPVLASWQYGLGRSIAWTSDMDGGWSSEWLKYNESISVFKNMVSWAAKDRTGSDLQMNAVSAGGKTEITVSLPYEQNIDNVTGIIFDAYMNQTEIQFQATAPGVYRGIAEESTQGAYVVNLTVTSDEESPTYSGGFSLPYSDELDIRGQERGETVLRAIAEATGGRVLNMNDDVYTPIDVRNTSLARSESDINDLLIVLSLLLFLLDVFVRRFPIFLRSIENAAESIFKGSYIQKYLFRKNEREIVFTKTAQTKITSEKSGDKTEPEKRTMSDALISQKKKRVSK